MREMRELLKKLAEAHGVSGYESEIREIVEAEIEQYVDEIQTDGLGNLIATRKGKKPSVMIAAHLDEIGLMVKLIEDEGFLRFSTIGGWFDQTLLNQRVILHTDSKGKRKGSNSDKGNARVNVYGVTNNKERREGSMSL